MQHPPPVLGSGLPLTNPSTGCRNQSTAGSAVGLRSLGSSRTMRRHVIEMRLATMRRWEPPAPKVSTVGVHASQWVHTRHHVDDETDPLFDQPEPEHQRLNNDHLIGMRVDPRSDAREILGSLRSDAGLELQPRHGAPWRPSRTRSGPRVRIPPSAAQSRWMVVSHASILELPI